MLENEENGEAMGDQLAQNTIFRGLTPAQIDSVLPCIMHGVRRYGTEECVYNKGDEVNNLGVVLDGALTVCDENADGKRTPIASIGKNGLFGEVVIFSTQSRVPHRVVAGKNARVLYLTNDFFLKPCGKDCPNKYSHQEILKNMLRLLSDRAITLNKQVTYLSAPDLKTKIAMYLCDLYDINGSPAFTMPLNRDQLARFFSVARPSLSRELVNMKNQGLIDFCRGSMRVLDLRALQEIARG